MIYLQNITALKMFTNKKIYVRNFWLFKKTIALALTYMTKHLILLVLVVMYNYIQFMLSPTSFLYFTSLLYGLVA